MFKTITDINKYYTGDRIQCLVCGKWFKELGWHLKKKHEMSCDEYKEKYGLPWSRGLVSEDLHIRKSDTAKRLVADGKIGQNFDVEEFRKRRNHTQAKPPQPFLKDIMRKTGFAALAIHRNPCPPGRERIWKPEHFEKYITEIRRTGKNILDIYERGKLPHPNTLYRYAKQNPNFRERLKAVSIYRGPKKGGTHESNRSRENMARQDRD